MSEVNPLVAAADAVFMADYAAAEIRRRVMKRIDAEQFETDDDSPWWPIPSWQVPDGIRFDVPGPNRGQIVEIAFGTFGPAEANELDPYRRVTDTSEPVTSLSRVLYYRRRTV